MSALCGVCGQRMHPALIEAGEATHPLCGPVPPRHLQVVPEAQPSAVYVDVQDLLADSADVASTTMAVPPMPQLPRAKPVVVEEPEIQDSELPHNGAPAPKVPVLNPEDTLFPDLEMPPPVGLQDRFGVPPFSVWDKTTGDWQSRKRRWLSMGIRSEVGRDEGLTFKQGDDFMAQEMAKAGGTTSIFDPVVCELSYRWWTNEGDKVLDPFAGGSVRGVVAGVLRRQYIGNELRAEQVLANRGQGHLVGNDGLVPTWHQGDATDLPEPVRNGAPYDFILSCPPYADLEVYSDDPRDLSNMPYTEFTLLHGQAIADAVRLLHPNRYAVWVISDVRDPKSGAYRGLVADTISAFQTAGADLYNDIILREPVGTARLRGANLFNRTRKVSRTHQHVLVFVKGDGKAAARRLAPIDPQALRIGGGDSDA